MGAEDLEAKVGVSGVIRSDGEKNKLEMNLYVIYGVRDHYIGWDRDERAIDPIAEVVCACSKEEAWKRYETTERGGYGPGEQKKLRIRQFEVDFSTGKVTYL
jgi:uncharacterized protein YfaS (alpha-2-macroglobulin family)